MFEKLKNYNAKIFPIEIHSYKQEHFEKYTLENIMPLVFGACSDWGRKMKSVGEYLPLRPWIQALVCLMNQLDRPLNKITPTDQSDWNNLYYAQLLHPKIFNALQQSRNSVAVFRQTHSQKKVRFCADRHVCVVHGARAYTLVRATRKPNYNPLNSNRFAQTHRARALPQKASSYTYSHPLFAHMMRPYCT